jgi:hypothetical protein
LTGVREEIDGIPYLDGDIDWDELARRQEELENDPDYIVKQLQEQQDRENELRLQQRRREEEQQQQQRNMMGYLDPRLEQQFRRENQRNFRY